MCLLLMKGGCEGMLHRHKANKTPQQALVMLRWLALLCITLAPSVLLSGCLHTRHSNTCPKVSRTALTGWVEQIEDHCAMLVTQQERIKYVHSHSLPVGTKEGDYLEQGRRRKDLELQADRELKKLQPDRRKSPMRISIGAAPKETAPPHTRDWRGRWKHWSHKRKRLQEQRKRRRWTHKTKRHRAP